MKNYLVLIPLVVLAVSCSSVPRFDGEAVCAGRVCDASGAPVENYLLSFGHGIRVLTGINGTFSIPELKAGTYRLSGRGKGWCSIEKQIDFFDKRGMLYVQVEPISAVYAQVESCLRAGLISEAERALEKESLANESSALFQFYRDVIAYCKTPSEQSKAAIAEKVRSL